MLNRPGSSRGTWRWSPRACSATRLARSETTASGMGWPVSAASTRPSMILAGSSARVISLPVASSVSTSSILAGEAEVADVKVD